ncbi:MULTISPECIES: hypothetical protein [unclassified Streptomyces]|jgi:hypothetical protein|uniref:hypothetical protein n=1 Tax=unclassified Streptomyces TaxID=2593676 RepID=UPI00070ACD6A|nr:MULTISPECIES: hypothetical protein [unclassified Streptomyces]KRD17350.1 hypothetical protein ASE41_21790 [Streptomyces sp. Root264]MCX5265383.1 hypothetical protein [Streptomyces sp. NBC_00199]
MRKLHQTALVAAMIASLGMAGAGIASAGVAGSDGDSRQCANHVENISFGLINIPNLNLPLLGSSSNQTATQQICNNGDDAVNVNVADRDD